MYIYAVSALLPPLGLWWGIPLLFQADTKSKIVGIVAIVLTIGSFFLSIKIASDMLQSTMEQLNQINGLSGF